MLACCVRGRSDGEGLRGEARVMGGDAWWSWGVEVSCVVALSLVLF